MSCKTIWHIFQTGFATFGGIVGVLLGGYDGFLYTLIALIIIDYASGVMCAIIEKKLSSEVGFRGIFKKIMVLVLVGIGHALDTHVIGFGSTIRMMVIFFYLSNEGVSILENASRIGLKIPEGLKQILSQIHKGGKGK